MEFKNKKDFFSDNVIFFDTEFTNIDTEIGELMSIALVKPNGEELYLELAYDERSVHPWVTENVVPYLSGNKISKEEALNQIWEFIGRGEEKPFLMAYVNQFDSIYWYRLFSDPKEHPVFWIPIDFASILFAYGFDPEIMRVEDFYQWLDIDTKKYNKHNALDDARKLKEVYDKFKSRVLVSHNIE
ncbi:MAG: 3'-5' exoribonuclease [Patescibacteria group bacterium]|nr:3'-5' exoribonuclease [Patescibacteria group bacterium]